MRPIDFIHIHLTTIFPCFIISRLLLILKKRLRIHKNFGGICTIIILLTASATLFMSIELSLRTLNHFRWIYSFNFLTVSIPTAYWAVKKIDVNLINEK